MVDLDEAQPSATDPHLASSIFAEVLDGAVGPDDNFFDLGGSSVDAANLALKLSAAFGRDVTIADVLIAGTPAALCDRLDDAVETRGTRPRALIELGVGRAELSAQQGWYTRVWRGETLRFGLVSFTIDVSGRYSASEVRSALVDVVACHTALRTTIQGSGEQFEQLVHPAADAERAILDDGKTFVLRRTESRSNSVEALAVDIAVEAQAAGVEPGSFPPFSAVLVQSSAPGLHSASKLVVTIHHSVFDGTSLKIFDQDLTTVLEGGSLAPAPVYLPYDSALGRQQSERAAGWWREYLSGYRQDCYLPTRWPIGEVPAYATSCTIPEDTRRGLARLAVGYSVPVSVPRLASLMIVMHALYGTDDVVITMPVESRNGPDMARAVGLYQELVAVRHTSGQDETVGELIRRLGGDMLDIMENRACGFRQILDQLPDRQTPDWRWALSGIAASSGLAGDDRERGAPIEEPSTQSIGRRVLLDLLTYFTDFSDRVDLEVQYRTDMLSVAEGTDLLRALLSTMDRVADAAEAQSVEGLITAAREDMHRLPLRPWRADA